MRNSWKLGVSRSFVHVGRVFDSSNLIFSIEVFMTMAAPSSQMHLYRGLLVPGNVTEEHMDKLNKCEVYPDDVWIDTYSRAGTTWAMQIVRLIRNNGVQDDVKLSDAVIWPEMTGQTLDVVPRPRTFKSHMTYDLMPCGPPNTTTCKFIYIIRNPKDVAVSYYYFLNNTFLPPTDWNTYWKMFIDGERELPFGNYLDHVLSWWPHRNEKNMLFLTYEGMKKNLPQVISQMASFIGANLSDEVIMKIADLTTFDNMRRDATANFTWSEIIKNKFFRKGTIGDWKNQLTPEQSAEMDAIVAKKFKEMDLEFEYK